MKAFRKIADMIRAHKKEPEHILELNTLKFKLENNMRLENAWYLDLRYVISRMT